MNENENEPRPTASDSSDAPEERNESNVVNLLAEEDHDFYAIREPEARVYPSDRNPGGLPSKKNVSGKSENNDEVSLESIYGRRREQDRMKLNDDEEIEISDPPELPSHPFRTKILRPFLNPAFFLKFVLLATSLWILFIPTTYFFNRLSKDRIKFDKSVDPSGKETLLISSPELTDPLNKVERFLLTPRGEVLIGAFTRYGYLFAVAVLIWGIVAVPILLQTFAQTATGDDGISDWPQWNQLAGLAQLLWLLLLIVIAGIPGYLILSPAGLARLGFGLSFFLLFPIFFLSSMETDSLFNLLSRNILLSFKAGAKIWRDYYLISIGGGLLFGVLFLTGIAKGLWSEKGGLGFWGLTATTAFFATFYSLFYFRFLGRLAWTVQDRTDRYLEEKESTNKENNNGVDRNA